MGPQTLTVTGTVKGKEALGRAVGNERMTAEGHAEQDKGHSRQAKEDVKDAFRL